MQNPLGPLFVVGKVDTDEEAKNIFPRDVKEPRAFIRNREGGYRERSEKDLPSGSIYGIAPLRPLLVVYLEQMSYAFVLTSGIEVAVKCQNC